MKDKGFLWVQGADPQRGPAECELMVDLRMGRKINEIRGENEGFSMGRKIIEILEVQGADPQRGPAEFERRADLCMGRKIIEILGGHEAFSMGKKVIEIFKSMKNSGGSGGLSTARSRRV